MAGTRLKAEVSRPMDILQIYEFTAWLNWALVWIDYDFEDESNFLKLFISSGVIPTSWPASG
jgi:hypothetical protein